MKKIIAYLGIILLTAFIIFLVYEIKLSPTSESADWQTNPLSHVTFPLDDNKAMYKIRKNEYGFYMIDYIIGTGNYLDNQVGQGNLNDTRSSYIGSSAVGLEKFIDRPIRINGNYRKTFGKPMCWIEGCTKVVGTDGMDTESALVVDISEIC